MFLYQYYILLYIPIQSCCGFFYYQTGQTGLFSAGPAKAAPFLTAGRSQFETKTSNGALDDGAVGQWVSMGGLEPVPICGYLWLD